MIFRNTAAENRKYVRCEMCQKYPNIIKQFHPRGAVKMAVNRTRYREKAIDDHIQTDYHKECERVYHLSSIEGERPPSKLVVAIDKSKLQMMNHVGKLMIQIFYDAKNLNLTAHSWPARYVTNASSVVYNVQDDTESSSTIPANISMQYVNKPGHRCLLKTIVNSHVPDFINKLNESWALSLRVDGKCTYKMKIKYQRMEIVMYYFAF